MLFSYYDKTGYPIRVSREYARTKDKNHVHNFMQIVHVNSGSYTHYLENASSTLHRTELAIIPAGCSHFADARHAENDLYFLNLTDWLFGEDKENPRSFFNLCLAPLGNSAYSKTPFLLPREQADGEIYRLLHELHAEGRQHSPSLLPLMRGKAVELMSLIASEYAAQVGRLCGSGMSDYCPSLHMALNYIHENYRGELYAEDVARAGMMSLRSFYRVFSESMGMSFLQYVQYLRLLCAKRLLKETDRTVSDIAESSGFAHLTHFNRTFMDKTGFTPRGYRRFVQKGL